MNSNGKITAPISLASDIYSVLGLSAQGGRYDVDYPCRDTAKKVNKFSRVKPIKFATPATLTDDQFISRTFGLTPVKALISGTPPQLRCAEWGYDPPTGGSSEPFRLTDFNGYNHRAVCPVRLATYEMSFDRNGDISSLVVQGCFKVSETTLGSGGESFGLIASEAANVEMNINELGAPGGTRRLYWGLAYVSGNTLHVAYCDNSIDRSAKGTNYSPGVVRLGDWTLGKNVIKGAAKGSKIELVPFIDTVTAGFTDNGTLTENAVCFPDGKKLVIDITESTTGVLADANWLLTDRITIYFNNREIGYFEWGSSGGSVSALVSGGSNTVLLEMAVDVEPLRGAFTITAANWEMDFQSFPFDSGYGLGFVQCTGVSLTRGAANSSASVNVSSRTTVYFKAEAPLMNIMQGLWTQSRYTGNISLYTKNYNIAVATARYTIPTSNTML